MSGSFSTSHDAGITFKMREIYATAHTSATFHVTTKTSNYNIIFCRDLRHELGIQLDFQENFIAW